MQRLVLGGMCLCLTAAGCGGNNPPPNTAKANKAAPAPEEPKFRGYPMRFWVEKLEDPDDTMRGWAIRSVGVIGAPAKETVPLLRKALKEEKAAEMRMYAAESLGKIGADAKEAVPDLITAIKDKEPSVRLRAAEALGEIGVGAKDALGALREALKNADDDLRAVVNKSIEKIKTGAEGAQGKPAASPPNKS